MTTAPEVKACLADLKARLDSAHRRRRRQHRRATKSHAGSSPKRGERHRSVSFGAQLELFGTPISADPLSGFAVKLPDTCGKCTALVAIVGPGKPPHAASLLCRSCGHHRGWISRANYTFLREITNTFGAPTEPIVFRNRSTKPEQDGDEISVVQDGMSQGGKTCP